MFDLLAILVLLAYGGLTRYTAGGAADPIWTAVQQRGVLRVGTDPGFRPFAEQHNGELRGYDIDLVRELGQRLGVEVEFVTVGYDALYDSLSTRRVDLLAAALPLAPEQGWRARFSTPYLNAGQVLVTRSDSPITNEGELAGRTLGVALGSDGDTLARALHRDQPAIGLRSEFETPGAALRALAAGHIDAVITDAVSAIAAANDDGRLRIVRALTVEPYVLVVPTHAYQLEHAVNNTLAVMRADGVFDRLNARWFRADLLR
jgi:ABC-type amino acid transport substrate-binding protein